MTPYSNIFDRFEKKITDFDLDGLIPANIAEIEIALLNDACAMYVTSTEDLSRDDGAESFTYDLTETSELILSDYMLYLWCHPYVYNQELFETHFSTMEYQKFSPSAAMEQIRKLMQWAERQAGRLATGKSIKNIIGRLK